MKNYSLIILFATIVLQTMAQQDPLVLTLEEATAIAKQNNFTLRDQQLDVAIAETQVDQTRAQGLPQVNAVADYQYTALNAFAKRTSNDDGANLPPVQGNYPSFNPAQIEQIQGISGETVGGFFSGLGDAFASKHQSTIGASLNQKLFDGVYLLGLKAADVYVELARVQTATTERDIEQRVEKAYYGALITNENMEIIDKNISNIDRLLFETRATYEAGFAEQLDIDRLVLSLAQLKNQRKNLEKIQELNYNVLKNTINVPLSTPIILQENIKTFELLATSDEVLAQLQTPELWPEFQIYAVQDRIQDLTIERYKKGRIPKVDAFINGNYGYQGNDFIFSDEWYPNLVAGLSISWNILDGGLRENQIKEAQLQKEKIQVARESLQSNIDIQIENALTQYLTSKSDVETQLENIELAEKIYETTKIKYREGVGSSVEMNQAEQDLYQAQQSYINALYDLLIAKVDLEQSLGK